MMLSNELEFSLSSAIQIARQSRHEFITVEHLLSALLNNTAASTVIRSCGGSLSQLRRRLEDYLKQYIPHLPEEGAETQPGIGFQRVIQRAILHVQSSGEQEVTGANVLVAIFSEKKSHAVFFLNEQGITRFNAVNFISHGVTRNTQEEMLPPPAQSQEGGNEEVEAGASTLNTYATNLNECARNGRIDPLIGRDQEVERTVQILCRRRKNNPLFVGESGVGKTAIAEGLARQIVEGNVPGVLEGVEIYALDMGTLLAGTKYRGDFEQRFKGVIQELAENPKAILFIDEIHTIIGAGAASGGAIDASNLLKPMLASGEIRCIGSTTYQEFRSVFEKDRALSRRFQKIDVVEPTVDESYQILLGLKSRFEAFHHVRFTRPALKRAVELSNRFLSDRHLPDKAIDVIDEAGARSRIQAKAGQNPTVGVPQVEKVVSRMARVPVASVTANDREGLRRLEEKLKFVVFGQDHAIEALASAIKLSRSGLGNPDRPISSFLFSGPTGVGKTEVSKQLAHILGIKLVRFDMSEYMERHAVSRLIGAPPGYVGFDQGGLLTDAVNQTPHAVVLLDEIEKAHPDIFNLLLQIMDYGTLTDNNGRKTDFKNVILIMTTNAGAERMARETMGFTRQDHSDDDGDAINKLFAPEFRNRIDTMVRFQSLNEESVRRVVVKFVLELELQLAEQNVVIEVDSRAISWFASQGYDHQMGARPMARFIREKLKTPLSDELLFGKLVKGGKVIVTESKGEIEIKIEPASARGKREATLATLNQ